MIEAEQLGKRFGTVEAVRDITFTARDGRVTGLLGPNGAGKSTTLRILYTAIRADTGRARIDGHDCAANSLAARRSLGVLPHSTGLYPHLSARENIRYYGRLHGLAGSELERRLDGLIELLDLGSIADRQARGFSQGQRIRVALARALVHEPRNVILDEPTNGLDVMAIRSLREVIRRLRDRDCCVLLSSHVMQEVAAVCDDLVVIAEGRVVHIGTPDSLMSATGAANLEEAFVQLAGVR